MRHWKIRLVLALLLWRLPAPAQQAWTIYNTGNSGLPYDAVNCIAFEAGGMKWIGTEYGLASFDDTTWTVYNTSNSGIPDNAVRSLLVDADNNKWIGTFLGGLAKFDGSTWTVYDYNNSALPDNQINALALDTGGVKWIGTIMGLVRFDDTVFTVYDLNNAPFQLSDNIADIDIDTNDVFHVGTLNGGLVRIVDTTWTVYTIPNGSGIPDNTQLEVDLDANGVEWMATPSNGLVAHPGGSIWLVFDPFTSMMPTSATTSLEILDNPARIWIGTYDKGIVRKTGAVFEQFDSTNSPFPDVYANFVERDTAGYLWIGTQAGGLVKLDETLLTGLPETAALKLQVFPVPATDRAFLLSDLPVEEVRLVPASGTGGRAFRPEAVDGTHAYAIGLQGLTPGLYFLQARLAGGRVLTTKLLKAGSE